MTKHSTLRSLLLALLLAAPGALQAQNLQSTSNSDRLFVAFIEDATLVSKQWWEGQLDYSDYNRADTTILRGIAAFHPWNKTEVGLRVGFGDSDIENSDFDGTGATDLDAWAKYFLGRADNTGGMDFAVGGVLTIPTGDDAAGLGTDAFALSGFGTLRYRFKVAVFSAHIGVQFNGDGQLTSGAGNRIDLDGKFAPQAGLGAIFPVSDQVSFVTEATYRAKRFDGTDSDARLVGGVNLRPFNRGMIRAALGFGLADGAPDVQLLVGYAANF